MKKCQHQNFLGDLSLSSPLVVHMHNDAVYNYTARSYSFFNAISPYSPLEMPLLLGLCSAGALALDCCYPNQKGDLWSNTRLVPWRRTCWAVVLWVLLELNFKHPVKASVATLWMRVWEWGSTPTQVLSEIGCGLCIQCCEEKLCWKSLRSFSWCAVALCLGANVCLLDKNPLGF